MKTDARKSIPKAEPRPPERAAARPPPPVLARESTGNALTIAAALAFMFLCMILPIVGPAATQGSGSPGAGPATFLARNRAAFLATTLVATALAALATWSKLEARKVRGGAFPRVSAGLLAACAFVLVVFAAGLLGI